MVYLADAIDDCTLLRIHLDLDIAAGESEWMTTRYQLMGLFRRHDTRDNRGRKYRALCRGNIAIGKSLGNVRRKHDDRSRVGHSVAGRLMPDINHRRLIAFINVTQLLHQYFRILSTHSIHLDLAPHAFQGRIGRSQFTITVVSAQPDARQDVREFFIVSSITHRIT